MSIVDEFLLNDLKEREGVNSREEFHELERQRKNAGIETVKRLEDIEKRLDEMDKSADRDRIIGWIQFTIGSLIALIAAIASIMQLLGMYGISPLK